MIGHSATSLYASLNQHLIDINQQIDAVIVDVQKQIDTLPYPENVTVFDMKTSEGVPVLSVLLTAKAQLLNGMAVLKAADMTDKTSRRR